MEHYITEINIDKLRHLSNTEISLNKEHRQHLIITGKNGSGKTSLLVALQKYLQAINDKRFKSLVELYIPRISLIEESINKAATETEKLEIKRDHKHALEQVEKYAAGVKISFNDSAHIETLYAQGDFVTAYFPAGRKTQIARAQGVVDIKLSDAYAVNSRPGELLQQYMVHLKTQQAYARNEGDMVIVERIQKWFERFVGALRVLLDNDTIDLEYDYKEYRFKIHESGRVPFNLETLSDGYSSVIQIVSDLILRMDRNWLLGDGISQYDIEGVVLIDEVETHLHIGLQKKILPFLTDFFPRIQFIVTTHSPYVLNSLSNVKVYDLENCIEVEDLSVYSSEDLVEGFFGVDEYSDKIKEKINRYKCLKERSDLTEAEHAERARIRSELRKIPKGFLPELTDMFLELEGRQL